MFNEEEESGGNCFLPSRDWGKGSVMLKKRQKSPRESSLHKQRIADFCGHLRTSTSFFLYACVYLLPFFVTTRCCCVCVYVYVKVISIFSSLLLNDSRFHCVRTSVLFGVVQTLELVVFASEKASP